jgi:hypothetical protein
MQGQSHLPQVVQTFRTTRGLARGLHSRQQKGDKDANDRNDD